MDDPRIGPRVLSVNMAHTALTPVFVGLRTGLHALVAALAALIIVRAVVVAGPGSVAVVLLAIAFLGTYAAGGLVAGHDPADAKAGVWFWLSALTVEWVALLWLIPEAAYLVFPLFFLYLHVLPRPAGPVVVVWATALAIVAIGVHSGWSVGGVVGPLIGAGVALLIGLAYQSLAREAAEREQLVAELLATRNRLAATQHESGVLAERSRLAREIHDTVAQGLSSIQMLLHAAERADADRPGIEHIRLARETAAANLADTRRFIRELAPPVLDDQGVAGALRRLAETQWRAEALEVRVRASDALVLPMHVQTALLRIAQGAMANVIQHSGAAHATISLEQGGGTVRLTVADDGRGFDQAVVARAGASGTSGSFGLTATRERVDQLGGRLTVDAAPGRGTTVTVDLDLEDS